MMDMDFLQMTLPPSFTITAYVANICHAAYCLEECYQAEEDDSPSLHSFHHPATYCFQS
jgi:hypothetical protein